MKPIPAGATPFTREEAQRRADRIRILREEWDEIERAGVVSLDPAVRRRLDEHLDAQLEHLASSYSIDRSETEKSLSLGIRIAALVGAVAFGAAVYSFFERFWSALGLPTQVILLHAAPLVFLAASALAFRREKVPYFTGLFAAVAFAAFVLHLNVMGAIFNVTPTPAQFLALAVFAGILAYGYRIRLLLLASLVCGTIYLAALPMKWSGGPWENFPESPENLLLPGVVLIGCSFASIHRTAPRFAEIYRLLGLLLLAIGLFALAAGVESRYLRLDPKSVRVGYEIAGFAVAGAALFWGFRRNWLEWTYGGALFLLALIYLRFFLWWWELFPRWLFFLVSGAVAVALGLTLKRLHAASRRVAR